MTVFFILLRCPEVIVSMYTPKLDHIQIPEKDKSTNGRPHHTNGRIRAIYGSRILWYEDMMGKWFKVLGSYQSTIIP
jgi:hypothetical protein